MNRFAIIALAFVLTACGGHDNKQPVGTTNTTTITQPAQTEPAVDQNH